MNENPLISVVIITYNSSQYICDALNSVKNQTYKNIELVVSDDCSTDNTVVIVQEWINNNRERFVDAQIIRAPQNLGVTCNANRGYSACKGEWIKSFAGDDLLEPACIEDNLSFILSNPEARVVLSNSTIFFDGKKKEIIQKPALLEPSFFDMTAKEQFECLVKIELTINSNSLFISSDVATSIKFDERIRFMEDRPFLWNCTMAGYKIYYLNKETVRYRKYDGALTGIAGKKLVSLLYYDSLASFYYLVRKPELEKRGLDTSRYEKQILWYLFVKYILKNKGNFLTRVLNRIVWRKIG